jgi:signal transduction histidine kinase
VDHDAESVTLSVEDDGQGFDAQAARSPGLLSGIGLEGMQERIESLGGALEIKSRPGKGTRVAALIPLNDR